MSNRADRRAAARQEQKENTEMRLSGYFKAKSRLEAVKQKKMDELQRNGITVEHLKENYEKGRNDGFREAAEPIWQGCFAAACLALHELYGFGKKRCAEVLNAMDRHMAYSITSEDAIAEVYRQIGLELDFHDPFERVREADS